LWGGGKKRGRKKIQKLKKGWEKGQGVLRGSGAQRFTGGKQWKMVTGKEEEGGKHLRKTVLRPNSEKDGGGEKYQRTRSIVKKQGRKKEKGVISGGNRQGGQEQKERKWGGGGGK